MNPILLKTLISLAASNKKPAPAGSVGSDAQLKDRIVLFADETVNLPDWGISGLPAMILGAAPQTCLFVSDLDVDGAPDADDTAKTEDANKDASSAKASGTVSFSLTIKSPPAPDSTLQARTIVWKLSLPIAGYRDVQTGASSAAVHAPVIKSRIRLGGVDRDVEIGLLEMAGLEQPLLIGKDTLADKFLIRPDRPADQKAPNPPSVDLTPKPAEAAKPTEAKTEDSPVKDASDSTPDAGTKPASDTPAAKPDADQTTDTKSDTADAPETASDTKPEADTPPGTAKATDTATPDQSSGTPAPDTPQDDTAPPATTKTADDTDNAAATDKANDTENAANPDSPSNPPEDTKTPAQPAPSQTETAAAKPTERENEPA